MFVGHKTQEFLWNVKEIWDMEADISKTQEAW